MHYLPSLKSKKNNHSDAKKSGGGFTLLEMMIAVFVILVGILGVMSLLQRIIFSSSITSSRLTAAYLAQEGAEIVRNIRDTNWLEARTAVNSWDEGLTVCGGTGFIADYNHSYCPNQIDPLLPCYSGQYININTSGFYGYSSGVPTKFKRKIIITQGSNPDIRNVLVEINWTDRGVPYSLSVQENLYNWR